jgi:hypothetical protein
MARREERWSAKVRVKPGALGGWKEHESPAKRRRALRRVARRDGAGEVSRRLNFISNVANRLDNEELHRVAREDQRWVAANLEEKRRSKPIRVRASRRTRAFRRARPGRGRRSGRRRRRSGSVRYV